MKSIVWNNYNKSTWPTVVNALILLINGRLPADVALTTTEQGLLMTVLTWLIVIAVPNVPPPENTP